MEGGDGRGPASVVRRAYKLLGCRRRRDTRTRAIVLRTGRTLLLFSSVGGCVDAGWRWGRARWVRRWVNIYGRAGACGAVDMEETKGWRVGQLRRR